MEVNKNIYNHVLFKLQDYMFSEDVLKKSIKYNNNNNQINNKEKNNDIKNNDIKNNDIKNNDIKNNDVKNNDVKNNDIKNKTNNKYFIPKQHDTLFWCFYIIKFGEVKYEMEDKNLLNEKKIKIEYVEKIRKNKVILKKYKFDTLTNIENNLVNDKYINLSTFFSLCCIENINIILINEKKQFYYELLLEDSNKFNIICDLVDIKKYGCLLDKPEIEIDFKDKLYKIENIDKPIKGMSSYKVEELINICKLLKINIIDSNTNKNKNKKELYESIIKYF